MLNILKGDNKSTQKQPLEMFCKKGVRKQNFIKKNSTQAFSWKICGILQNTYFEEHLWITASKHERDMRGILLLALLTL